MEMNVKTPRVRTQKVVDQEAAPVGGSRDMPFEAPSNTTSIIVNSFDFE